MPYRLRTRAHNALLCFRATEERRCAVTTAAAAEAQVRMPKRRLGTAVDPPAPDVPTDETAGCRMMKIGHPTYADIVLSSYGPKDSIQKAAAVSVDLQDLSAMVHGLMSDVQALHVRCMEWFVSVLDTNNPSYTDRIINAGVLPRFVEFLQRHDCTRLQSAAVSALINVTAVSSETSVSAATEAGIVPILIRALHSPHAKVRENAVWVLGNVIGNTPADRDLALRAGVVQPLLHQLNESATPNMERMCAWTLSNLCRGVPRPNFDYIRPVLHVLIWFVHSSDEELVKDGCWAFSYISAGPDEVIQEIVDAGVIKGLVEALQSSSIVVLVAALRTLGNIASGTDAHTQAVLDGNVLPALKPLLSHGQSVIRREACGVLSNIAAGTLSQVQALVDSGVIADFVRILASDELKVRHAVVPVVREMTVGGSRSQLQSMIQQGCIAALCSRLARDNESSAIAVLETIESMLQMEKAEAYENRTQTNQIAALVREAMGICAFEDLRWKWKGTERGERCTAIMDKYFSDSR